MRLMLLLFAFLLAVSLPARLRAEPAQLTSKQISDGWILLFDGETDFGWKAAPGGTWTVSDGALSSPGEGSGMLLTTTGFGDFELTAESWRDDAFAMVGVYSERLHVGISTNNTSWAPKGQWSTLKVRRIGDRLTSEVSGNRSSLSIQKALAAAKVSATAEPLQLSFSPVGKGTVRFRNVKLRPLGLKSIFNGKDLTGWKEVPGHKSVYSATPEGWMHVVNGNGDIQTERTWGDFIMQIEIQSNGDHLNSGVFFRANPGKFWSGYEAQIRNQWEGDDRTKAVDYGTGGIYNRQPARRVVSSDREWFTMTIVAAGKHLATWVNGIQVTDFTDPRPEDQTNARAGARTAPGVVSLQGHDPTTDLYFRNIRIAELPK